MRSLSKRIFTIAISFVLVLSPIFVLSLHLHYCVSLSFSLSPPTPFLPFCFSSLSFIERFIGKIDPSASYAHKSCSPIMVLMFSLSSSPFISFFVLSPSYSFVPSFRSFSPLSLAFSLQPPIYSRSRIYLDIVILARIGGSDRIERVPIGISGKSDVVFRDCQSRIGHFVCSKRTFSRDLTLTLKRHLTMYKPGSELVSSQRSHQANIEASKNSSRSSVKSQK